MVEIIVSYTMAEGGSWLKWPEHVDDKLPPETELKELKDTKRRHKDLVELQRNMRQQGVVCTTFILLHSLCTDKGREWDCINGWRNT